MLSIDLIVEGDIMGVDLSGGINLIDLDFGCDDSQRYKVLSESSHFFFVLGGWKICKNCLKKLRKKCKKTPH